MGQTSEELRAQIAGTRADMTATVDAMSDRANPKMAARRQAGRVGGRISAVKETIMGSVDNLAGSVQDMAGSAHGGLVDSAQGVASSAGTAPQMVQRSTQGNPIAAGLIAFGAGLLVASLLPSSDPERRAASSLADSAQPVMEHLQEAASEVTGELKSSAQEAFTQVKETAADAAGQVKEQASDASQQVTETAKAAAGDFRDNARDQMG